jgi:Ala-tRNA(Pro) deacylase
MSIAEFLQQRHVSFEVVPHETCFGAQHLAEALHTPGRQVAKSVLLRADHNYRYFVALLPATHMVDFECLRTFLGGAELELASEREIAERCPGCELGVLPPFGTHYGAQTIVDRTLTEDDCIAFECDSHSSAIRMKYHDFHALEHPLVADFARPAAAMHGTG